MLHEKDQSNLYRTPCEYSVELQCHEDTLCCSGLATAAAFTATEATDRAATNCAATANAATIANGGESSDRDSLVNWAFRLSGAPDKCCDDSFFPLCNIWADIDGGKTSCIMGSFMYILMVPLLCSCWIISSGFRKKLRNRYNLVEAPAEDWTIHLFCPCCSLCQEFRELKNRGMDPSLGWKGNLAKQQHSPTAPSQPQFMSM